MIFPTITGFNAIINERKGKRNGLITELYKGQNIIAR